MVIPGGTLAGWRITGLTALALGALTAAVFGTQGFTAEALHTLLRGTARISAVLFLGAFAASSLRLLWPNPSTVWMLRNRRYLGVSMAVSHFTHLIVLFALGLSFPHPFLDELLMVTVVVGGAGYVMLAAMTVTSFAGPRRRVGERRWHWLHTSGIYLLWFFFTSSYSTVAAEKPAYWPVVALLLAAAGLRLARRLKLRRAEPQPVPASVASTRG